MVDTFFTIIIPVHNKRPHLERSVNSVLNQSYPNFELLLIDDASTDGSAEKLTEFTDSRIKLFTRNTPGPGGYAARNIGIKNATYSWICFLDADDEWDAGLLGTLNNATATNPEVNIFSWGWSRMNNGLLTPNKYFSKFKDQPIPGFKFKLIDFLKGPSRVMWTGAVAIKKSVFETAGDFPENRCIRGGDVDLWIRCLHASADNMFINKNFSYYHVDSVNMVTKNARPTSPCYYSTLVDILKQTTDKELITAIHKFQNENLYAVAQRNVKAGGAIDHKLLLQMKPSVYMLKSILKVYAKKLISMFKSK